MSRLPSRRPASGRPLSMFDAPTDYLKQLGHAESTATSEQSKRRSLLPQFSSSRKVVEDVVAIPEDSSRSAPRASSEMPDDRKAMPPPSFKPASAAPREGLAIPTRTSSHMRPPSSTTSAKTASSTHTRVGSRDGNSIPSRTNSQQQAPATAIAAPNGLKRNGSTRLHQSSGPRTSGLSNGGAHGVPSTTAQKRSSATIAKPPVLNTAMPAAQMIPAPSSPTRSSATRPTTRSNLPPPSKPAFSTYQQHYSPAKCGLPKPPIPTAKSLNPSALAPEDETISHESAIAQIELLQLSLLHQEALPAVAEYDASAKRKLGKMHGKLQREYVAMHEHEQEQRRQVNLHALEAWCPDAALLTEHLSSLSRVVSDLRSHTEPGSRYSEMAETFATWADRAEAMLTTGQSGAAFLEALPEPWRATHTSLALNLRSLQRDLSVLPPLPPRRDGEPCSSLEIMVDHCVLLVDGMLRELEVMTKLQREVLQQGKCHLDQQINALMCAAHEARAAAAENWQPAWLNVVNVGGEGESE